MFFLPTTPNLQESCLIIIHDENEMQGAFSGRDMTIPVRPGSGDVELLVVKVKMVRDGEGNGGGGRYRRNRIDGGLCNFGCGLYRYYCGRERDEYNWR